MHYCPNCNINIEGEYEQCPICQNEIEGEGEGRVYPTRIETRARSIVYKSILFVFLVAMLSCVATEYLLNVKTEFSWSGLVCVWVIGGAVWLWRLVRKHNNPSKVIFLNSLWPSLLVFITLYILGYQGVFFAWILPAVLIASEVLHYIHMMVDKSSNAMAYLLGNSGLCIGCSAIYMAKTQGNNVLWVICLLIGVTGILGAIIFKGRSVSSEIQKRFHV